jgi:hypothetical protein
MAAITSNVTTGNWSATGSWSGGVVPGAGDTAIIANGAIITVDAIPIVGATSAMSAPAVTINGASSSSFGTLLVASGATLTLRGTNTSTAPMMKVNRWGLFAPQPGSTVRGGVPSDFGSCILNSGRFEAIGSSGSHITFGIETSLIPSWGAGGTLSAALTPAPYDTQQWTSWGIAAISLGTSFLANSAKTGLGSIGDSASTFSALSNVTLTTERSTLAGLAGAGDYFIDYDIGVLFFGVTNSPMPVMSLKITPFNLDRAAGNWRGWGIVSNGATTFNTCLIDYCDFTYMGAIGNGLSIGSTFASAPVNIINHLTPGANGADATRNAYVKNSTFNYCVRYALFAPGTGASGDPMLFQGNTCNNASGGGTWDGISTYGSNATYLSIDSNAFNTRGSIVDLTNVGGDVANLSFTSNTGRTLLSQISANNIGGARTPYPNLNDPDITFRTRYSTPDLYVAGNNIGGGNGCGVDGRGLVISGTSGHPAIVENNTFHHFVRFGHVVGSYVTFRSNVFYAAYHHGFTGSSLDDGYCTQIYFYNNLFVGDRGASGNASCAAVQLGYNHRIAVNDFRFIGNTVDGWKYGGVDFNDKPDSSGWVIASNVVVVGNIIANGGYNFVTFTSGTVISHPHVLECDFNVAYNPGTAFGVGLNNVTKQTGFYSGSSKYNRLAAGSRNVPGVALFDASYTTVQTGRSLVWTVTSLGVTQTLAWGSGDSVSIIFDSGTSAGGGLRTLACTGKSTWTTNLNSIRSNWLWIVSGTGAGQVRPISYVSSNVAHTVAINSGGTTSTYAVGNYLQLSGGTADTPGAKTILKVTSIDGSSHITGVSLVSGGGYSTAPSNPVACTKITTGGTSDATFNVTWAPGLLLALDFTTAIDATSVFAIVNANVKLWDTAGSTGGSVYATLCPTDPGGEIAGSTTNVWATTTQTDSSITVVVANSPTANPNFVTSVVSSDPLQYKVTAGSSALDAGTSDNAPVTDYFGTTRPQGASVDIGFFELAVTGGLITNYEYEGGEY